MPDSDRSELHIPRQNIPRIVATGSQSAARLGPLGYHHNRADINHPHRRKFRRHFTPLEFGFLSTRDCASSALYMKLHTEPHELIPVNSTSINLTLTSYHPLTFLSQTSFFSSGWSFFQRSPRVLLWLHREPVGSASDVY